MNNKYTFPLMSAAQNMIPLVYYFHGETIEPYKRLII